VYEYYLHRGFDIEWRKLNFAQLVRHHNAKDMIWGLDEELKQLRGC